MSEPTSDRASLRRTIERLRTGTPPTENLDSLTQGLPRLEAAARGLFLSDLPENRLLWIRGPYGSGKSHALGAVRDLAHRSRFATAFVSADGFGTALNHPQRVIPALLRGLALPSRTGGYSGLLSSLLATPATATELKRIVGSHLSSGRDLDNWCRMYVGTISDALRRGAPEDAPEIATPAALLSHLLSGETIAHSPPNDAARESAYSLLQIAQEAVRLSGEAIGVVVEIDEVESIFTKLRDRRSRRGAYRTLSALGCWPGLAHVRLVLAVTPDGDRWIRDDVRDQFGDMDGIRPERWRIFSEVIGSESRRALNISPLQPADLDQLTQSVAQLYRQSYPDDSGRVGEQVDWIRGEAARMNRAGVATRHIVRSVVDRLDSARYLA